jgi:hypothetical protein
MNLNSNSPLYQAAVAKYQAQKAEALATLTIYLNGSVGIGEHSDLLAEVDKYTELLANAEDKLQVLSSYGKE